MNKKIMPNYIKKIQRISRLYKSSGDGDESVN